MTLLEIGVVVLSMATSIFFQTTSVYLFFTGFLFAKRSTKNFTLVIAIFFTFIKLVSDNLSIQQRMCVFIIVLTACIFTFFYGSTLQLLYHVFLYSFILIIVELIYSVFITGYSSNVETQLLLPFILYSILSLIPLIAILAIVKWLTFFKADNMLGLTNKEYLFLMITPMISIIFIIRIRNINFSNQILVCIFLIIVNVIIILNYNNLSKKNYLLQQFSFINEQNKFHEDYISRQNELVKLKHDLKNILINFDLYLQADKIDEARAQLRLLIDTTSLSHDIRTGCIPIDAILNKKLETIKQLNIKNNFELQVPMELDTEKIAVDLAAILGNLLDNAIEATQRIANINKEIVTHIKYEENKLYIYICNTSNETKQDFSQKIIKSEKSSNRYGIGISSIKERVDRLNGYHDFKYESGYFKVLIILPL